MTVPKLLAAMSAAALLTACEARFGNDAAPVADNATAENRAEEGRLTVEAPGFNMSLDIPDSIIAHADIEDENGLFYPGSRMAGLHVQGGREEAAGGHDGEVEMRFTTPDAIGRVVAWYRDPARAPDLRIVSAARRGNGAVLSGTHREGERFTIRLEPRAGGGTEARLLLSEGNP